MNIAFPEIALMPFLPATVQGRIGALT